MPQFVLIEDGVVVNVAVFPGPPDIPGDWRPAPPGVGRGHTEGQGGGFDPPSVVTLPTSTRQVRDTALGAMTYDPGQGRELSVRPLELIRIRDSIAHMTAVSDPSTSWLMVSGPKRSVTVEELADALADGQAQSFAIWDAFEEE